MLTAKQEQFVLGIIQGMSQAEAYRSAYKCSRMSDKTVWENASRLMANSKVTARVNELREQLASKAVMTAQERLEWLSGLIKDDSVRIEDKLKASDQMNKMQGEYKTKVEGSLTVVKKLEDLL